MSADRVYFQDYMPGNVCFGCGSENPEGLRIKSYWEGDEGVCTFESQPRFHGWEAVINGGVLATVIDCHTMCTAMADAYRREGRSLASDPVYRYATGTITVRYLKPTPNDRPIVLRARVVEVKGRRTRVKCDVLVDGVKTAEGEAIGFRVLEGEPEDGSLFR
jgi:acyl-coenzyme A thioesterase PaaI-like protein